MLYSIFADMTSTILGGVSFSISGIEHNVSCIYQSEEVASTDPVGHASLEVVH